MSTKTMYNKESTYSIWLCDLTHTYQTLALNRIPLGIGLIASYFEKHAKCRNKEIKLFRSLIKLRQAFSEKAPDVIGLTNAIKNNNLNIELTRHIKEQFPKTIFGGPNFPEETKSRESFLKKAPWIDFYVVYEGEEAFCQLVTQLIEHEFNIEKVKQLKPQNSVFLHNGNLVETALLPRIDISKTPSPYLEGYFDEFLQEFKPLVQFSRGCPFSCTFCTMSKDIWRNDSHRGKESIAAEIEYIGKRVKPETDLFIADSNFGMYQEDVEACKLIANIQDKYSWPTYITASTGKNNPARVIEICRILKGAPIITLAVQSTDSQVLKNVKRQNISIDNMFEYAEEAKKISPLTYSDIILGLPGDCIEAHLKSIKDVMNAGIETIIPHTLMLFEGSEVATMESKELYKMETKYRALPRCFGRYKWINDKEIVAVEIEEMCVSNSTLSFDDYKTCRLFHLTNELFYNDGILQEFLKVAQYFDISAFDFIESIHRKVLKSKLKDIYNEFISEVAGGLWDTPEALIDFIKKPGVLEKYRSGEYGANLIMKYKSKSLLFYFDLLLDAAFDTALQVIGESRKLNKKNGGIDLLDFLKQLKQFCYYRKSNLLETSESYSGNFNYAFHKIYDNFSEVLGQKEKITYHFYHSDEQKKMIEYNKSFYGETLVGFSKLFAQISAKKFFRQIKHE